MTTQKIATNWHESFSAAHLPCRVGAAEDTAKNRETGANPLREAFGVQLAMRDYAPSQLSVESGRLLELIKKTMTSDDGIEYGRSLKKEIYIGFQQEYRLEVDRRFYFRYSLLSQRKSSGKGIVLHGFSAIYYHRESRKYFHHY